jgi:serine/threonine protein kinase
MGDYLFTEKYCIGQGSFGKVYKGRHVHSGKEVAIKEMDSQLITEQEISREITILKQLKHPNIVEYQDAFQVCFNPSRTMASSTLSPSIAEAAISGISWILTRRICRSGRRRY